MSSSRRRWRRSSLRLARRHRALEIALALRAGREQRALDGGRRRRCGGRCAPAPRRAPRRTRRAPARAAAAAAPASPDRGEMVEPGGDHGLRPRRDRPAACRAARTDASSRSASRTRPPRQRSIRAGKQAEQPAGRPTAPARRRHRRRTPAPPPARRPARRTRWARARARRARAIRRRWLSSAASPRHSTRNAGLSGACMARPRSSERPQMKTWKPSRRLVTQNSRMDSTISAVDGRDRRAVDAEARDQDDAEHEIEHEGRGIDRGADALLAQHVEQPLDRADRGARHQPDRQDEHQVVAVDESRAEQRQQRLAHRQDHDAWRRARPRTSSGSSRRGCPSAGRGRRRRDTR